MKKLTEFTYLAKCFFQEFLNILNQVFFIHSKAESEFDPSGLPSISSPIMNTPYHIGLDVQDFKNQLASMANMIYYYNQFGWRVGDIWTYEGGYSGWNDPNWPQRLHIRISKGADIRGMPCPSYLICCSVKNAQANFLLHTTARYDNNFAYTLIVLSELDGSDYLWDEIENSTSALELACLMGNNDDYPDVRVLRLSEGASEITESFSYVPFSGTVNPLEATPLLGAHTHSEYASDSHTHSLGNSWSLRSYMNYFSPYVPQGYEPSYNPIVHQYTGDISTPIEEFDAAYGRNCEVFTVPTGSYLITFWIHKQVTAKLRGAGLAMDEKRNGIWTRLCGWKETNTIATLHRAYEVELLTGTVRFLYYFTDDDSGLWYANIDALPKVTT